MVSETGMKFIHRVQIFIELLPPIIPNWRVEKHVQNNEAFSREFMKGTS